MIGQNISHYKVLEKLGGGGMGVVYKAEDTKLKRLVALKFLPPDLTRDEDAKERFVHEAQAASALDHLNICNIHEIDETEDGQMFICMAYYDGHTLKKHIARGTTSVEEAMNIAIQTAEGLAKAHAQGIVHRDIKPANIMLTNDGVVKIVDFGLAKLAGMSHVTRTGTTVGTVAYMSPEQARGEPADQRSDIFSLGVLLYELVTGELPFKAEHQAALLYQVVNTPHKPLSDVRPNLPPQFERIVNKSLEKNAPDRYQLAEELLDDLKLVQKELTTQELLKQAGVPVSMRKKTMPWVISGTAILLIIIGIYLFYPTTRESADRRSIAVLPFANLSEDKENQYFSDGITEDIITQLSRIGDLRVISRTSTMRYRGTEKTIPEIGKELDVATILEGSVRREGNQVRIVAQLVDVRNDEHLWAETYDKELTQIFAIQSNVARRIAEALKATLSPIEKERIEKKATDNLDAYTYYLKGREYYYRYHKQDNENAIELFKKALELDPNYALAYAGLGDAYGQGTQKFGFAHDWGDSAIAASQKAISLDPNLAEAYKSLSLGYGEKGLYRKALASLYKSVELNPNYFPAVSNIGWGNWLTGRFDEALFWFNKGLTLNPAFPYTHFSIGMTYLRIGDYPKSKEWFKKALELQPDFTYGYVGLSLAFQAEGQFEKAVEQNQKILAIAPDDLIGMAVVADTRMLMSDYALARQYYEKVVELNPTGVNTLTGSVNSTRLGYVLWEMGQQAEARNLFRINIQMDRQFMEEGNESFHLRYDLACIHAIQGQRQEAYAWLQKAIDAGWRDYQWGTQDPLLENLRNDEEFKQKMEYVRRMVNEMRQRVEQSENP